MRLSALPAIAALTLVAGCVRVDSTTRVERGPLLRTFQRPEIKEGGLKGVAQVQWPTLRLEVRGYDVCRELTIDEYAEDHITEKTSPAAGPAFSMGVASLLASGALFGASLFVPSQPDTSVIDQAGNYGPAPRTAVRTWAWVTLGVGVPALAVGIISLLRTGEETVTERVEQLSRQQEAPCHERAMNGPVVLRDGRGPVGPEKPAADGVVAFEASEVTGAPREVLFFGRPVELDEGSEALLEAFGACVQVDAEPARGLETMGEGDLLSRAERLRSCRRVRGDAVKAPLAAVEAELGKRRLEGSPGAFAPGPNVASFEDAVSAYAPKLKLTKDSADLAKLDAPEALGGQAVILEGIVVEGLTANIGVIQVGEREVFMFIPTKKAWGGDFGIGARIEAVAVVAGWQTVGEKTLPLVRAVWMQTRF